MNVKKVMQALQAFHPRLFMGSERFKVCTAVADYQSVYEPEGIYVLNSLETKGCHCAPTIVTCNFFQIENFDQNNIDSRRRQTAQKFIAGHNCGSALTSFCFERI